VHDVLLSTPKQENLLSEQRQENNMHVQKPPSRSNETRAGQISVDQLLTRKHSRKLKEKLTSKRYAQKSV
jgi:hypothetical protein